MASGGLARLHFSVPTTERGAGGARGASEVIQLRGSRLAARKLQTVPWETTIFTLLVGLVMAFLVLPVFEDLPARPSPLPLLHGPQGPSLFPFSLQCLLSPSLTPTHHLSLQLCPPTWAAQCPVPLWATQLVSSENNLLCLTLGLVGRTAPVFPRGQTPSLLMGRP